MVVRNIADPIYMSVDVYSNVYSVRVRMSILFPYLRLWAK